MINTEVNNSTWSCDRNETEGTVLMCKRLDYLSVSKHSVLYKRLGITVYERWHEY